MVITLGELIVEFVSNEIDCGLKKITTFSGPFPSGAPAIFINQASKVGAKTKIYGSIGNDIFGESLINRLKNDGVDTTDIQKLEGMSTGTAHVSYFSDKSRVFIFHIEGSAAEQVTLSNLPKEPFMLHISCASVGIDSVRKNLLDLCSYTIRNGGKICCDPNMRKELTASLEIKKILIKVLEQSEIIMPSLEDLELLYPNLTTEQSCYKLLNNEKTNMIVLKMGELGVKLITKNEEIKFPAYVVKEIDPTGAGDCFCGTFIGMMDIGYDAQTAVEYANAAGAIHVTNQGAMENNPTIEEIAQFIKNN
ncbi:MAG: sugar kinase [Rhodobacterales bacterium]|jgi:sugar/nucleoside kinase (ribokinase family)|nr:sugar kinase [Rhodobacterales bacterium]